MSPALTGWFFTTELPRKPTHSPTFHKNYCRASPHPCDQMPTHTQTHTLTLPSLSAENLLAVKIKATPGKLKLWWEDSVIVWIPDIHNSPFPTHLLRNLTLQQLLPQRESLTTLNLCVIPKGLPSIQPLIPTQTFFQLSHHTQSTWAF